MFIYIQTTIVYVLLTIVMYLYCKRATDTLNWKFITFACVAYALVFGFRYGVGADYFAYELLYDELLKTGTYKYEGSNELLWGLLMKVFATAKLPYWGLLMFTSFVSITLTFRFFRSNIFLCPFFVLSFMLTGAWLGYSNVLRQVLAGGVWICSLQYILKKKAIKYYLMVFIAILIHWSSLMLLFVYPLFVAKRKWYGHVKYDLLFLLSSIVLMNVSYVLNLVDQIESLMLITGYDYYVTTGSVISENTDDVGIGFFISLCRNIFLISLSGKIGKWSNDGLFNIVYPLYLISVLLGYALWGSLIVSRIIGYFSYLQPIIGAYALAYIFSCRRKLFVQVLALFFCVTFASIIYRGDVNSAFYVFQGQSTLYYIKKPFYDFVTQ